MYKGTICFLFMQSYLLERTTGIKILHSIQTLLYISIKNQAKGAILQYVLTYSSIFDEN